MKRVVFFGTCITFAVFVLPRDGLSGGPSEEIAELKQRISILGEKVGTQEKIIRQQDQLTKYLNDIKEIFKCYFGLFQIGVLRI